MTKATENEPVDFLRGLCISAVVLLHFTMVMDPIFSHRVFSLSTFPLFVRNGYYGVTVFYVISGYLITMSLFNRFSDLKDVSLYSFYLSRFARIFPLLTLAILANVVFYLGFPEIHEVFQQGPNQELTGLGFFKSIVSLYYGAIFLHFQDAPRISYPLFNGVLWSLAIEETFYFFYPIFLKILRRRLAIIIGLVLVVAGAFYYRSIWGWEGCFQFWACMDQLALGCLVAISIKSWPRIAASLQRLWLPPLMLFVMAYIYLIEDVRVIALWSPLLVGLSAAIFILSSPCEGYRRGAGSLFRRLGRYSYEIYLSHPLVSLLMVYLIFIPLDEFSIVSGYVDLYFLIFIVVLYAISSALSRHFSEPIRLKVISVGQRIRGAYSYGTVSS